MSRCCVEGCSRNVHGRGVCKKHYNRLYRTGDVNGFRPRWRISSLDNYIEEMTTREPNTGCWLWLGSVGGDGYPEVNLKAGRVRVHRYVCEKKHGPPTSGMLALHSCDQPLCVNPDHMRFGTYKDNVADMFRRGRDWASRRLAAGFPPRTKSPAPTGTEEGSGARPVGSSVPSPDAEVA